MEITESIIVGSLIFWGITLWLFLIYEMFIRDKPKLVRTYKRTG